MTFEEARQKLAEMAKGNYRALQYELTDFNDQHGGGTVRCTVYIHGQNHHHGKTWEEALSSMQGAIDGPTAVDTSGAPGECHAEVPPKPYMGDTCMPF